MSFQYMQIYLSIPALNLLTFINLNKLIRIHLISILLFYSHGLSLNHQMKPMLKLSSILLLLISIMANCQEIDSSAIQNAINSAIDNYHQSVGIGQEIYNGKRHVDYLPNIAGYAYYSGPEWQSGSVLYDGILYKDFLIKYDEVGDEVLIRHPEGFAIILFKPRVQSFNFNDHSFIYYPQYNIYGLKPGFYEKLIEGNIEILARRNKIINENVTSAGVERKFIESFNYYALKDNKSYSISRMKDLYELLGSQKKDIQQYLKKNKIKFRKNKELSIFKAAEYFNQHSK